MKFNNGWIFRICSIGLTLATLMDGLAPRCNAEEMKSEVQRMNRTANLSVMLAGVIAQSDQSQELPNGIPHPTFPDSPKTQAEWEEFLANQWNEKGEIRETMIRQAMVLTMSGVSIGFFTPQPVISPVFQPWEWQGWCWTSLTPPVLPPPQAPPPPPVTGVPEPTSLVSGLIGIGMVGFSWWRRKRRK